MGMAAGGSKGPKSDINMTPLIDVVLVLLVIFMVMTPLLQMGYEVSVPPKPPDNWVPTPADLANQLIISVGPDRTLYVNKTPVTAGIGELMDKVQDAVENRGIKMVFFSCDEKVNYGDAVGFLDAIRNARRKIKKDNPLVPIGIILQPVPLTGSGA